jgi:hypothetical protein
LEAVWLCEVAERQMLRPSVGPPWPVPMLCDLTRYRVDLLAGIGAGKGRAEKLLEDAQIKLSVVASDIFGTAGRAMMTALIAGEHDRKVLAQVARTTYARQDRHARGSLCGASTTITRSCWR